MAINQIVPFGLSSLQVIYYLEQLFSEFYNELIFSCVTNNMEFPLTNSI
ncbi:conserved hypothetical protein [Xenorhabdus bovienii str. feltiae Florida]|uniref:Uncharacterized protein n=1 Tax=Xenorhabdus bovienii str. feltiae Moldova TaxID=1398200 RepID=A0A077NQ45_XENBV|nr:conserved hypothetical protein [Xenorhabdus bovienii str. feltiae France]CDG91541.1 conserved hypothetical protein [Xenorhabdus bovienii str. feltiae Florida]CDG99801.1 conserved hypothetical protein [Xenorhabdus bovienii str. feltiae Moldova]